MGNMPELPEVETTVRAIKDIVQRQTIKELVVRQPSLRYKIPPKLARLVKGQKITEVSRRAKYILLKLEDGCLLIHLGMSGNIKIVDKRDPVAKHDHYDLVLENKIVRYNDTRRFGFLLWDQDERAHRMLGKLGPEPLERGFSGDYLYRISRNKQQKIKQFIMDAGKLVGVGNIYASESLWRAGISPLRPAGECSQAECRLLATEIKKTLKQAITAGGTSFRDFKGANGKLGYFVNKLNVYGKEGEPCPRRQGKQKCKGEIRKVVIAQRASFFCPKCQK